MSSDLVATWTVSLPDGKHKVEFEHGTTSGKRVITVDGREIHREEWMFKLVGKEHFKVGNAKCTISIDACSGFAYEYTLEVNGKPLEKFRENQNKIQKCWCFTLGSQSSTPFRVVLEKDTLNVWVNGKVVETTGEFTDNGTETHFALGETLHSAYIEANSSGKRREGIVHRLFIDDQEIPPAKD
ncbi:fas apoptotic inhibitory molecule 1-like [Dreissena polymorpha]|uniref:Fas apoptotic inhibitory molecule n=1 Tax=Dreissena polymorpha TaxID=45954 RepID=A0A9D4RHE3_DREPO|nr:fas apoptotic inhibitory molecule 1-like [Dreissena polymorpha]XP_052265286.1 fas apoptotic inhibitory molecule 1-like [Dreissena polymorpha]XP_052265287.1 fas apoptotic inhibitory molecule 1-like [Dreissena polymorpha]XP_052265288.1 fas apoptotic inhibitory molecule 1-like [Dreissena polymorpha]KAH3868651.1 hypothetical protein DPMN_031802 [Dreissena polymorpha]